jgi:3',5'-cyclic AMP phosphodiesterase CpdA
MRLCLLSDLHFGRARAELVPALLETIQQQDPDLVAIAGDFVQRARKSQYSKAQDFLRRLRHPWIAVPGNHDIPLINPIRRFVTPRRAFRRYIAPETEPLVEGEGAVVAGIDTTYRLHHQSGYVREAQIERIARLIRRHGQARTVVILAHHPFHHGAEIEKKLMRGAPRALDVWAEAGRHVILSGHLHRWTVEPFVTRKNQSMTLQVHVGTGLSTRLRGEPNECALLEVSAGEVMVERHKVPAGEDRFVAADRHYFAAGPDGWVRQER